MASRPTRQPAQAQRRRSRPATYLATVPARQQAQRGMTSVGEEREPASWLTGEVRMDPFLLRDAHRVYADRGGREDGRLAARRLLDERLRQMVHWPTGQEYARLAEDLDADGRWADAALLRQIAATDHLLTEAQTHWNTRYATRPQTAGERDTRRLIDAGLIDFDPDGPYRGIDGSNYWPGYTSLETGPQQAPVVLVSGRGLLATGHRIRGPGGGRAVAARPRPDGQRTAHPAGRAVAAAGRPGGAHPGADAVPPRRSPRLDGLTAAHHLHRGRALRHLRRHHHRGQHADSHGTSEHVAAELGRRMDWVPEWALPRHGGQGTPWPQAYLRRLANTEPLSYAVPRLLADDTQARLESAAPEAGAQRSAGAARHALGDAGKRPVARAHRRRSAGCDPAGLAPVDRARARRPGATDVSTRSVQSSIEEGNQHELARRISAPTARSGEEQVGRNAARAVGLETFAASEPARDDAGALGLHADPDETIYAEMAVMAARAAERAREEELDNDRVSMMVPRHRLEYRRMRWEAVNAVKLSGMSPQRIEQEYGRFRLAQWEQQNAERIAPMSPGERQEMFRSEELLTRYALAYRLATLRNARRTRNGGNSTPTWWTHTGKRWRSPNSYGTNMSKATVPSAARSLFAQYFADLTEEGTADDAAEPSRSEPRSAPGVDVAEPAEPSSGGVSAAGNVSSESVDADASLDAMRRLPGPAGGGSGLEDGPMALPARARRGEGGAKREPPSPAPLPDPASFEPNAAKSSRRPQRTSSGTVMRAVPAGKCRRESVLTRWRSVT